jgi:DAK2 domain fusion protein YloV
VGEPAAGTLARLDAAALRRWVAAGLDALSAGCAEIDGLNVYPLPDGDTGSNLLRTWQSVADGLGREPDAGDERVLDLLRQGAIAGARGNSGVILGAWLTGLAAALEGTDREGPALARALRAAADGAPDAVAEPVAGTILSVAAAAAVPAGPLVTVVSGAAAAARAALAATPEQLPALAAAGVVDAGGRGLVVLLEALEAVVLGRPQLHVPPPGGAAGAVRALVADRESGSDAFAYEVQYLLEATEPAVDRLRAAMADLGDSLVVVGDAGVWNVHVHVNDVGAALELGVEAGRPYRVTVTRFADERPAPAPVRSGGRLVVAVCEGPGLAALFEAEGAVVVPGPQPSVGELVAAVTGSGAAEVVLLPCDGELLATAQQAAAAVRRDEPGLLVTVVPTASPVQGLAALAVAQPERPFGDDGVAMADASGRARVGAVSVATREALTSAGRCVPGDVLGVVDRDVVLLARDVTEVACALLDRMLAAGGELVTLVTGDGLDAAVVPAVVAHLEVGHRFVDVTVYDGGQPTAVLLGVE